MKTKILILESNPRQDLQLNQEIRDLQRAIDRAKGPEQFLVVPALATRWDDLQDLFLEHAPQIVHFCGHGVGAQGLVFLDGDQGEKLVATAALSGLFDLVQDSVKCVLLNACYSAEQAGAIVQHIDYVIGMQQEIRDDAARHFALGFYRSLASGKSIEIAYKFGCNAIQLMLSPSGGNKRSLTVASIEAVQAQLIPEHLKPVLLIKSKGSQPVVNQVQAKPTPEELQDLSEVLEQEDVRSRYRQRVREYLKNGKLETFHRTFLNQLRGELGLAVVEANQIVAEELAPFEQARQDYGQLLQDLIRDGCYPLTDEILAELKRFQASKGLTDREVAEISAPILAAAEQERLEQERLEQERLEQEARAGKVFWFEVVLVDRQGQELKREPQQARQQIDNLPQGVTLERVFIPGGVFRMGAPDGEAEATDWEKPQHSVTVPPFFMGKYPVTQAQWRSVASLPKIQRELQPNPAHFTGDQRPVERVSWLEAVEFCERLSGHTGQKYRLPSEAEWEYACRGGAEKSLPFYFGETITTDLANYRGTDWEEYGWSGSYGQGPKGQYRAATTEVGIFLPNAFGLYDMHGNVWEWCADHWHENYAGAPENGTAWINENPEIGSRRVIRGGSWLFNPRNCRSACRIFDNDVNFNVGFRVVCCAPRTPT